MYLKKNKNNIVCSHELKQIRKLAQTHGQKAFERLVGLLDSKDERLVLAVVQEILNRAYGKSDSGREGRDDETGPTVVVIRDGQRSTDETGPASPDRTGAVKKTGRTSTAPAKSRPRNTAAGLDLYPC